MNSTSYVICNWVIFICSLGIKKDVLRHLKAEFDLSNRRYLVYFPLFNLL